MKGIILAAGQGSRLAPLTDDRPKCMVALAGKPLLHYQLEALKKGGVDEIAVVTGYLSEVLDGPGIGSRFHNPDWARTQMVASLLKAEDWLKAEDCIISYSDIFYGVEVVEALVTCDETCDVAIGYDPDFAKLWKARSEDPLSDLETFRKDAQGNLLEIGARPSSMEEIEGQYMGLLRFQATSWPDIRRVIGGEDLATLSMTGLLARLIEEDMVIACLPNQQPWGEVDTPEDLTLYENMQPSAACALAGHARKEVI